MNYLLNQASLYLSHIADYQGAVALAQAALEIVRERLPEDHRHVALALANIGSALAELGQLAEAEAMLADAVRIHEAHRPGSADLAGSYDLHGGALLDLARAGQRQHLPRAVRRRQQALALRRHLSGRRSEPVALSLNNLGAVRDVQGRAAAAARLYEAALGIYRAVVPAGDAWLAYGAMNTGAAWLESGAAERAEPLLKEALAVREAVFAAQPEHPERRTTADWLISCLLVRALAGEDRAAREAEAQALCDRYGFDFARKKQHARTFPYRTGSSTGSGVIPPAGAPRPEA